MATLYLTEQGSVVTKESNRLGVEKEDRKLLSVPLTKINAVLVYGNVQITTQAASLLMHHGIDAAFLTTRGKLKGRLTPPKARNNILRLNQYKCHLDHEFSRATAAAIVKQKISSMQQIIALYRSNYPSGELAALQERLADSALAVPQKQTVASILGVEGGATALYFKAFRLMFRHELRFGGRNRRPPTDEINALLSFGYVLLGNELQSLLEARGFDPYIGFLHAVDYGRASLALDLLEEFRQPVVDRLVLYLANKRILSPSHFEKQNRGVRLTPDGLKLFLAEYEKRLMKNSDTGSSFRHQMRAQTDKLANAILQNTPYLPWADGGKTCS